MLISIIILAGVIYLGLTLLLYLFQERLLYFPTNRLIASPEEIGLAYETIRFEASDGVELAGWYVPAEEANRPVLLYFHGNAGNISHRLASIGQYHRLGLNVFIIDYRGYGLSQGQISEAGSYRDAAAAWRYLVAERQIDPGRIIIFGRSLGGAVGGWLASRHTPGALILESTFTSIPDMAARQFPFLPVRWLARLEYDTLARLPVVDCPVLIIHSQDDSTIPFEHGRRLFEAAQEPKEFLKIRGGHNDGFMTSARAYEAGLQDFIDRYVE